VTGGPAADELLEVLRRPGLRRLLAAVRERRERLGRVGGRVMLAGATADERQAVAELFGLPVLPTDPLHVDLPRLDRELRASRFAVGLDDALLLLGGPLRDYTAERAAAGQRRESLWTEAAAHPVVRRHPRLERWLADLRRTGLLGRLEGRDEPERLLAAALTVLDEIADRTGMGDRGSSRLPVLASRALGSSHALDAGRPAANLVLRALAVLADRPVPASATERRDLWDWAGVVSDELSCDVLTLGLVPSGGGALADALRSLAAAGEPVRLTLRQLAAYRLTVPAGLTVRICENPVVVAGAADRWGPAASPLVCAGGQPSQAVRRLLADLAAHGTRLLYHGDFDWPGLRIANSLAQTLPLSPWRFGSADYRRALAAGAEGPPLAGDPVAVTWDLDLPATMAAAGVAVEEEAVLDDLLSDLGPEGED
jgi:uncharacterized protein (TIGR02679 family)